MQNHPRLRHGTLISRSEKNSLVAMVGRRCIDIEVEEGSKDALLRMKRYLTGDYSVEEIAGRLGIEESDVRRVLDQFDEIGILAAPAHTDRIRRDVFLERVDETVTMWRRQMSYHPLFGKLESGAARIEVFHGLIVETYHYVNSASTHIANAIAHCENPHWKVMLSRYFAQERGHEALVLQTLMEMGFSKDKIVSSNPNIGTTSLIGNLCHIGSKSTLGYFLCLRLMEGQSETVHMGINSLHRIAKQYGIKESAVQPIITHALMDEQGGHGKLLEEALQFSDSITVEEANLAVNSMHDMKHSFDQYYDQILMYYSNVSSYVPRPRIDFFCI